MWNPFIFIYFLIKPNLIWDKKDAAYPWLKEPIIKNKNMLAVVGPGLFNNGYFINDPFLIK